MPESMESYLKMAVIQETKFLQSRRKKQHSTLPRDLGHPDQPATVPASVMFHKQEIIVVKVQATSYLKTAYLPKELLEQERPAMKNTAHQPFVHRHDFFEFNYVYRGKVSNCLENKPIVQTNRQILLMNPYAVHNPQPIDEDTVLFNLLVDRSWAENVFASLLSFDHGFFNFFLDSIYGLNRMAPYLILDNTPELTRIFHQMIAEYFEEKACYQQILFSKLIELFAILSRQQDDSRRKKDLEFLQQRDVADILNYIKVNYREISLAKAAEFFNYTPNYLSKIIKRHTGRYFSDILQEYKLESACNYLTHSSLSIEKINEIIGYSDASYFSKVFSKRYGLSPNQYRQQHTNLYESKQ